ncbi:MAG: hypothetical protein JRN67_07145, partial [Nitrososphaerota archaeon]|nr:hypothetical protein [Nitrososphaerota archaeon]
MNTKILSLVVLMTFVVGAFSVVPAYASSNQVSVRINMLPCAGAPASYALNSTNYATVQYIQNGKTQTIDVYQNTTIRVDRGSIMVFPMQANYANTTPVGVITWVLENSESVLINASTSLRVHYCPDVLPFVKLLFGGVPYSSALGVLQSAQQTLTFYDFTYNIASGVAEGSGLLLDYNNSPIFNVPTQWYNSTGVWQLHGNDSANVLTAIESGKIPVFNYVFAPGEKPTLPKWTFNSNAPLYAGGTVSVNLSTPYSFFASGLFVNESTTFCTGPVPGGYTFACAVGAPGNLSITAYARVHTTVLAPSPGGVTASVSTGIVAVKTVKVFQVVSTQAFSFSAWMIILLAALVAAGVVSLFLLYRRSKRRED